jgi:hypothetical protein
MAYLVHPRREVYTVASKIDIGIFLLIRWYTKPVEFIIGFGKDTASIRR